MELSKIAKITNILLKLFLVGGTVTLFFIKKGLSFYNMPNINIYTAFFTYIGICCLYIVFEVTKIFSSISDGNPFITANEISLKKIAVTCELIAISLFAKIVLDYTVFLTSSLSIMMVFLIAGLCAYVFSQLFKLSVFLKEENDMTI